MNLGSSVFVDLARNHEEADQPFNRKARLISAWGWCRLVAGTGLCTGGPTAQCMQCVAGIVQIPVNLLPPRAFTFIRYT